VGVAGVVAVVLAFFVGLLGFREASAPAADTPAGPKVLRPAMDLANNRMHAGVYRDGHLVVDAGSLDFLKYVDGGWKTSWLLDQKDQGRAVAMVAGLSATLTLPVDETGAGPRLGPATLSLWLRGLAPQQRVSVFVQEKSVGTFEVDSKAIGRLDVPLPAGALKKGENKVRLTFRSAAALPGGRRSAAALAALALGNEPWASPSPPGALVLREVERGGQKKAALAVPESTSSRLSFYVQLPEDASLLLWHGSSAAGARAVVQVASDRSPARKLAEAASGAAWTKAEVSLDGFGGEAVRVDLIGEGGVVDWAEPTIAVKAPAPAAPPAKPVFDHVFIWMVDTLRADKVHAYNPKTRVETPNYDRFIADATQFVWAQVPGTWSLPSHSSLLTGVYPVVHKATAHQARLSPDVPFIAEELKKKGFKTALYSSNGYVSSKWGFERGWDVSRNFIRENLPNGADYLWKTGKPWVLAHAGQREFAYLATVEPHVIYNPKPAFLKLYWKEPYKGPIKPAITGVQLGFIKSGKLKVNATDKAYLEALQDGEITQSDTAFATFIADLKAAGLYDKSVVVVVSDHGDEFWDHGDVGHGQSVYQELTRIPLVIRAPGRMPLGKAVNADVEVMDLYATLLDLAGVPVGPKVQGTSLVPLSWDEVGASPRAALSMDGDVSRGLKVGRYRLVSMGGRFQLFDELEDRREQKNVLDERPIATHQMRSTFGLLHAYEARWIKSRWGTAANVASGFWADGRSH
jgi:hypothetical protein